jgi:anti-sigma factor RsiW
MREIAVTFPHPSDDDIAAYLNGGLTGAERGALEAHLAACRTCRTEATSARRLLRTVPARHGGLLVASLAAAAVLTVVLLVPRSSSGPIVDPDRDGNPGEAPALRALAPLDGSSVRRDSLRFMWRSEPGDLLYRLTIASSVGDAVWTQDTNDTTLALPDSVRLAPGAGYLWYVDALDAAGVSITTGPRRVRIAP